MKTKIFISILIISTVFILYFSLVRYFFPDISNSGQFGDMFGGINALFSGLAFLGVIYAVILQRKELELQRKELELTRNELKRTAEAQEKSEQALSKQAESLKMTAKLNGLSSLLQFELAKPDTIKGLGKNPWEQTIGPFRAEEAEGIRRQIQEIIDQK